MTKALFCTQCVTIRTLHADSSITECDCGSTFAWWVDSSKGTAKVFGRNSDCAWMIGFHNSFLVGTTRLDGAVNDWESWQTLHAMVCESLSDGYIFAKGKRDCWAAPFRPGWTNDVNWATFDEFTNKQGEKND